MKIELRSSTEADRDWVVELKVLVLRDDLERLGRFDPVRARQRASDAFSVEHTRIIVADGHDVGSVSMRPAANSRWLELFYLVPHAQGRGIGGQVLERLLAEPSAVPVRLIVLRGSSAQRLYERHHFTVESEDDVDVIMAYRPPGL